MLILHGECIKMAPAIFSWCQILPFRSFLPRRLKIKTIIEISIVLYHFYVSGWTFYEEQKFKQCETAFETFVSTVCICNWFIIHYLRQGYFGLICDEFHEFDETVS